jgi:hypothetical protein
MVGASVIDAPNVAKTVAIRVKLIVFPFFIFCSDPTMQLNRFNGRLKHSQDVKIKADVVKKTWSQKNTTTREPALSKRVK